MVFEQLIYETQLSFGLMSLESNFYNDALDREKPFGLLFYADHKIESFEIRKELNCIIVQYLNYQYDKCLDHIKEIKKIQKVCSRKNPIYIKVLFMELLTNIQRGDMYQVELIRNIKAIIKHHPTMDFESLALKLLVSFTSEAYFKKK